MAGLKNVLLVEDDAMIRDLYRTVLVRDGFHTEVAGDSEETFLKLKQFHPDVIFLDIMLPGLSGLDILRQLRTNPEYNCQNVKIILLTNIGQHNLDNNKLTDLADGYIVKADILPSQLSVIIKSLEDEQQQTTG